MSEQKLSIVFMGTPQIACSSLEKVAQKETVLAVVTQLDKPAGRGKKITPPPVKLTASRMNIPVYQPQNIQDKRFLEQIAAFSPDLIVTVAFGKIIPRAILEIPRILPINLHLSLLPKYRGPAPVAWSLINGEIHTGVTVHKIAPEIDEGEIILQKKLRIDPEDNRETLSAKLAHLGTMTLIKAIDLIKQKKTNLLKHQSNKSSYAPKVTKETGKIDWKASAQKIHNLIRGVNPYPGAYTTFLYKQKPYLLKIQGTSLWENTCNHKESASGTIIQIKKEGFIVKTGAGALLVKEVQLAGKNRISAYDFIKGYRIQEGFILGNEN